MAISLSLKRSKLLTSDEKLWRKYWNMDNNHSKEYKIEGVRKFSQEMADNATKREKLKGKVDYKIFLGEFHHFIKLPITFLLYRSDKRVQTEHGAGDKGFSNDPSLCLRGGVHLLPPNLCHARAHPARAGDVRLHKHRNESIGDRAQAK